MRTLTRTPHRRLVRGLRMQSTLNCTSTSPKEFKVVLDNNTLYIDRALAEALGWNSSQKDGVQLTLSGWAPHYFAIARSGSDSDLLARSTVESSNNPNVQAMLEYLKDR
ncbi:hypothetical protein EVG20_g7141 [Dentipellis fragilis]|uniref:Uncharacterized protein n=1 Tax=Dentipellis fragilis TaxID=205917 RepID=A0A4Y9YJT7_9AGAM|nr:hypothetical protein EVG20_g7141 [Dentipellis fragilis]